MHTLPNIQASSIVHTIETASNAYRKTSLSAGILYLLTFVSIPTLSLYSDIHSPGFVTSNGPDTPVIIGGILEIIVALAGISTSVVLYPILKKQNETAALGLIAARILESCTIFAGVAFLLAVVTLRQSGAGEEALAICHALIALYDRIFLLGQSFMPAICDLLLGIMLYKSRLVPRALSLIGLFGGPILLIGYFAVMFGLVDRISPIAALTAIPVALFEFSLGVYLVVKGFNKPKVPANWQSQ